LLLLSINNFNSEDIGLPAYDSLSIGARVVDALFQGLAARASGFAIVPVANMAPALQFLYVVMMYIAIYPVGEFSSLHAVIDGYLA
jgi:Trk-type K+ transport system membrane component